MAESQSMSDFVGNGFRSIFACAHENPANRIACPIKGADESDPSSVRRGGGGRGDDDLLPAGRRGPVEDPAVSGHVEIEGLEVFRHPLPDILDLGVAVAGRSRIRSHGTPTAEGLRFPIKIQVDDSGCSRQAFQGYDATKDGVEGHVSGMCLRHVLGSLAGRGAGVRGAGSHGFFLRLIGGVRHRLPHANHLAQASSVEQWSMVRACGTDFPCPWLLIKAQVAYHGSGSARGGLFLEKVFPGFRRFHAALHGGNALILTPQE